MRKTGAKFNRIRKRLAARNSGADRRRASPATGDIPDNPELSWSGSGACEGLSAHAISSGAETEHYAAIALRLFEEARDRPFCRMACFGVMVVVSIKSSRSAASQC